MISLPGNRSRTFHVPIEFVTNLASDIVGPGNLTMNQVTGRALRKSVLRFCFRQRLSTRIPPCTVARWPCRPYFLLEHNESRGARALRRKQEA